MVSMDDCSSKEYVELESKDPGEWCSVGKRPVCIL